MGGGGGAELHITFYMILLSGLELTFFSGVYGTCIAQNKHFGEDRKGLLGISGMMIGAGEIIGKCHMTLVLSRCFLFVFCHNSNDKEDFYSTPFVWALSASL